MGRMASRRVPRDPTVVAVPFYFATMAAEHAWLRRRARRVGPSAGDYERRDTLTSLAMGLVSLVAPLAMPVVLRPFTPGRGRWGRATVATAAAAVAVTTIADRLARPTGDRAAGDHPPVDHPPVDHPTVDHPTVDRPPRDRRRARAVSAVGGVVAVVAGGVAVTSTWASRTTPGRLWRRRVLPDLGRGPLVLAAAVVGWDFIYYWNHRFMHESRYMWAVHVVHHSSEHYNLSTALRQPVAEAFGTFAPYGGLCLLGIPPDVVETARGINLLYQYWIHTETIGRLGPAEAALNTPSHHRVHHGSNSEYLDRNHGSILIVWDRLFGTFEPERARVVYGLTKNIHTFDPRRVIAHEYVEMLRDVAGATGWKERMSYVVRGPGWATRHRIDAMSAAA